ncbi:MAG: DUF4139 domain-containing protein [Methanomassiliicoccaceae archaeon]|nr:DUF4139 domain-containing protein [Methanomassiliicoccaceae archaeon]
MADDITQAIVYLSGAQITRARKFRLKEGINKITFKDLPEDMNGQSITASSDGRCVVLSVSHTVVNAGAGNKRISGLYAKREELSDMLKMERNMFNVLTEEENLIRKNAQTPDGRVFRSEDMKNAVLFFRERMASLCNEKFASQKKIEKLTYELSEIESQIGMDDRNKRRSQVDIEVHSDSDSESELTISYFIRNAGWIPYYDVRVKDIVSPLSLSSKASVYQNTGEDWNNISMVLSTGNPSLSGNLPDLRPWYLDFYEPYVSNARMKQSFQAAPLAKVSADSLKECVAEDCKAPIEADRFAASTAESVASVEYTLPVPYTILSSENGKAVDILTHELKAEYQYICVRKLEKDVFLVADVKDWAHLNLLAGSANIFFEDKYVGEITIDPRRAEEGLRISLGRDKNVIVTRVRGKDHTAEPMLGQSTKASREWTLTAKNLRKQKIDIIVEDQIPVSVNKAITVDAAAVSGAEHDRDTGKLTWKFSLDPAASKTMQVKYTVTYPKNKTVILE